MKMYSPLNEDTPKIWSSRGAGLKRGMTLIELTVVIIVLLVLIGASIFSMSGYREYKLRQAAELGLRSVYTAQRTYLAEHPTKSPATLTSGDILEMKKYMSNGANEWPSVYGDDGSTPLIYNVKVSPPVFTNDPSGDNSDGKWDLSD